MSFLRRHWPDLIISLLIVALLIGFGMVLLGGNRKSAALGPEAQTPTPPATQAGRQPTPPNNTDTTPQAAPASPTPAPQPTPTPAIPQAPSDQNTNTLPTIPAQPEANTQPQAAAPSTGNSEAQGSAATSSAGTSSAATPTPTAGAPVPTSRDGTPTRREYRVSVGTYGSEALARERTAALSARGYTVHLIPVEGGVVAQIGPFADEATGRKALADILQSAPGAILRAPVGQTASQGSSVQGTAATSSAPSPSPSASQGSAAPTPTPAPSPAPTPSDTAAAPPPPANTPLYLQVGAFDQQDRAQTLVQQLRDLGYEPSIIAPPGRKVRVLVGPYTGDALVRTENRLSQNGIEHFRVR